MATPIPTVVGTKVCGVSPIHEIWPLPRTSGDDVSTVEKRHVFFLFSKTLLTKGGGERIFRFGLSRDGPCGPCRGALRPAREWTVHSDWSC